MYRGFVTQCLSLFVLATLPLAPAAAQQGTGAAGGPPASETRKTASARAVLLIVGQPWNVATLAGPGASVHDLQWTVGELIRSQAKPDVLDAYDIRFSPLPGFPEGTTMAGILEIFGPGSAADAAKALAAAERALQEALGAIYQARVESLDVPIARARAEAAETRQTAEKLTSELHVLRRKIIAEDAMPGGLDEQLGAMKQEHLKLRVELAGLQARREAITKHIAQATEKLQGATKEQEQAMAELRKVVELRQGQVQQLSAAYKQGAASISEVQKAQIEEAQARGELDQRRRQLAQTSEQQALARLNDQLADVQIEITADEARLGVLDRALARLQSQDVQQLVSEYRHQSRQIEFVATKAKALEEEAIRLVQARDTAAQPRVIELRRPDAGK